MTLQELHQELTLLGELHDSVTRWQGFGANGGPVLDEINGRAALAINAAAADPGGGDEWLFVHQGDASVIDDLAGVEAKVSVLFGANAPDPVSWQGLRRGGIGWFALGGHRGLYFLGRFPRGTIKL